MGRFADFAAALEKLPQQIEEEFVPKMIPQLEKLSIYYVRWRIEKSAFGDSEQPAPRGASHNAAYTLEGEADEGGIRLDASSHDPDGFRVSVHNNPTDSFGKSVAGQHTKPLMESGEYLAAFRAGHRNSGGVYTVFLRNSVGMLTPDDQPGMRLWEVLEYGTVEGTGGIPPRPHIGPALRDAVETGAEQFRPHLRNFILHQLTGGKS